VIPPGGHGTDQGADLFRREMLAIHLCSTSLTEPVKKERITVFFKKKRTKLMLWEGKAKTGKRRRSTDTTHNEEQ